MPSEASASTIITDRCPPELTGRCALCVQRVGIERARVLSGFTTASNQAPEAGDITMCAYCGAILTFALGGIFPEITQAELDSIDPDQRESLLSFQKNLRARLDQKGWD